MNYTICLRGETPSKKNSRINTKSGRSFPNRRFTQWHDDALAQILKQGAAGKVGAIAGGSRLRLTVTFYHGDKKRRDSDNQLSSILDLLVDAGVLEDDNWQAIPEKHVYDVFDKDNARAVIALEELKEIGL